MADEADRFEVSPGTRKMEWIIGLILLALLAWAYVAVIKSFYRQADQRFETLVDADKMGKDYIDARLTVTSLDPVKEELGARLELEAKGRFLAEDEYTLAQDVTIYINSLKGKQMETLKKGSRLQPIDVVLGLYDGDAGEYPFDEHLADLDLSIEGNLPVNAPAPATPPASAAPAKPAEGEESAEKPEEGKPAEGDEAEARKPEVEMDFQTMPLSMEFEGSVPGFDFELSQVKKEKQLGIEGFSYALITITRSSTVLGFSIFINALIWAITITILIMTFMVWRRGRKLEFGMMTFFAAMLFAFPAIRNLQPNVPPIGALPDFLSVFWAQGLTGVCLVIMVCLWLARPVRA